MPNSKTVFLIEDDDDDQELFMSALEEIENVTLFGIARNGKEAIERLHKSRSLPSIIFLDIEMPVMNGLECLQHLARDPTLRLIPLVMLSSSIHFRDHARFLGAMAFIEKPNSSSILRDQLKEIIQLETKVYTDELLKRTASTFR